MRRLVKPSDYVPTDILGRSAYIIPWEERLCPGNPADDPESGARQYNEFALAEANGHRERSPEEQVTDIIEWAIATPGEAARKLAADLAAAYQGKYRFRLDDLERWDVETKSYRSDLAFRNDDLRNLSASKVMALRSRSTST
ncbi:hypothetical protein G7009_15800 [Pseudomonas capeferrum]|uniref:hypothetical protein n=1 Tax=Pseudomonas capeferrum TaxID=1495066 RepID=UPI0015E48F8F|nr:hypothetical protein [Pseudomonas capeferrum]MBA1203198.1 hypothetical protein [Pseudomonas capeferrum]